MPGSNVAAALLEQFGAGEPSAVEGEIGRITLPLAGSITEADAAAIQGYGVIVTAAAGILIDREVSSPNKALARELLLKSIDGLECIVTEHQTMLVEKIGDKSDELDDEEA